jgi:HD-GYP domain-containing protein (c-di-GMP phosphodiesterase class II)
MRESRPKLVLLDGQAGPREQITSALGPLYAVKDFSLTSDALRYARTIEPNAILISEARAQDMHYALIKSMRLDPHFATTPIVILLENDDAEQRAKALHAGATSCVAKPYKLGSFVDTISIALSANVEKQWESLPPLQAAALKCSVEVFNSVSGRMAAGEEIAYSEISIACQPLLAAVNDEDINGLLQGVRDHDDYTFSHSLRVSVLLSMLGRTCGLTGADQNILTIGGLLHDIGKIAIPPLILNKAGKLSDDEIQIMQGHVPATLKLLAQSPGLPRGALIIAGQHHEKIDGSGYPDGLSGGRLNDLARMAAIVDVFGALTDRRVYKAAMSPERALGIMSVEMRRHLDMGLLSLFRQMLLDTRLQ